MWPRKAFIIRRNGQRAKIFSARFDEDYEEPIGPREPIQIEEDSYRRQPVYSDRLAPTFKTEDTRIPIKYEMLLKEEADSLMSQQTVKFSLEPSQELSTQKSMTFTPSIEATKRPAFGLKTEEEPLMKKEEVKPFKFDFKVEPKAPESAALALPKQIIIESEKEFREEPRSFSLPEKPSLNLPPPQPEVKSQPEVKPFILSEMKAEPKVQLPSAAPQPSGEAPKPFTFGTKIESPSTGAIKQTEPFTFSFASKPTSQTAPSIGAPAPKEKSEFVFGTPTTTAASQEPKKEESKPPAFPIGSSAAPSSAPFVFGSQPSQPAAAPFQFSFGSPSSQQQQSTQPSSFGSPATTQFTFGSTESQPPQSPFTFSQSQPTQQPQFAFGSQPATSQPSQFSLGSQPATQFSFGSTQPFQSQPTQTGSEGNIPSSPFSTTTSGRKISQPILKRKR